MQSWEVVGGADKGGILVREGQDLKSRALEDRLSTGAIVKQLALVGERLHYELEAGSGPDQGWVSINLKDKPLLVKSGPVTAKSIFDFDANLADGSTVSLSKYKSPVTLIVNTASKCGFTKHYEGLQKLHADWAGRGLTILAFPCNQFFKQEAGDDASIQEFVKTTYGVEFPVFAKSDVNGPSALPLFQYLKEKLEGPVPKPQWAKDLHPEEKDIQWNFTKFLCVNGRPLKRFSFDVDPETILADIRQILDSGSAPAAPRGPPLLLCLYSSGYTQVAGRATLQKFCKAANDAGFPDQFFLDNYPEPPYDTCTSWDEYVDKAIQTLEEGPERRDRRLVIVAHSLGCHLARGIAQKLGDRVLKLYLIACRPCHLSTLESLGVTSANEFAAFSDDQVLEAITGAWTNKFLASFRGKQLPPMVKGVTGLLRQQYGSKVYGAVIGDASLSPGVEKFKITAPILGIVCNKELSQGETKVRMQRWKDLTSGGVQLETVDTDHFGCLDVDRTGSSPLHDIVLKDMRQYLD